MSFLKHENCSETNRAETETDRFYQLNAKRLGRKMPRPCFLITNKFAMRIEEHNHYCHKNFNNKPLSRGPMSLNNIECTCPQCGAEFTLMKQLERKLLQKSKRV